MSKIENTAFIYFFFKGGYKLINQYKIISPEVYKNFSDHKANTWIREKTNLTDIIKKVTSLKWKFASHTARQTNDHWIRPNNNGVLASTKGVEVGPKLDGWTTSKYAPD